MFVEPIRSSEHELYSAPLFRSDNEQLRSALFRRSPANNIGCYRFPGTLVPKALSHAPAKVWQQISAHVILAEKLDESVGWRSDLGDELVKASRARGQFKSPVAATTHGRGRIRQIARRSVPASLALTSGDDRCHALSAPPLALTSGDDRPHALSAPPR